MADTQNEPINLNQKDATIRILRVAGGWDLKSYEGENIDVDLSCFLLDKDGQTREDPDFVFYNNLKSADMSVRHMGDNRDGMGAEDDEAIIVDVSSLSYDIYKIVFVASIYLADERNQNFTHVDNAFIRVINEETEEELTRDDMQQRFETATAVKFCELERLGSDWYFKEIHEPAEGGLKQIAEEYGCLIASIG